MTDKFIDSLIELVRDADALKALSQSGVMREQLAGAIQLWAITQGKEN